MEPELKHHAALRAARTFAIRAAAKHFDERREDVCPAGHFAAECPVMNEANDAYEALAKAVGAFEHADSAYLSLMSLREACRRAKAEADRLAAPYLETEESMHSKRDAG